MDTRDVDGGWFNYNSMNTYIYRFVFQTQLRFSNGSDTYYVLHKLSIIEVNCFPVRFKLLGFFSNRAANKVSRRLVLQDSQGSALGRASLTFQFASWIMFNFVMLFKYKIFLAVTDLMSFITMLHKNLISLLLEFIRFLIKLGYLDNSCCLRLNKSLQK